MSAWTDLAKSSIHNGEGAVAQWGRGITRRDKLKVIFLKKQRARGAGADRGNV